VLIKDAWNFAGYFENAFYTEPFQKVLLKENHTAVKIAVPKKVTHVFKAKAPLLAKGQTLCLLGSATSLNEWDATEPVLMSRAEGQDAYSVSLNLTKDIFPVAYKYGIYDVEQKQFVAFEEGNNRVLYEAAEADKLTVVNDGFAVFPIAHWKGAGVAIPVFSLRSSQSFGVGEFADIKLLTDWCTSVGLKLIQILPINDTTATHTWTDSYPYAAISAFALHPMYLNLKQVAGEKHSAIVEQLEEQRQTLNALPEVDYEAVVKVKMEVMKQLYPLLKKSTFTSASYKEYFNQNKHWLVPYAVFCYLRDIYGTSDFNQWPEHNQYKEEAVNHLLNEKSDTYDAIAIHYFIQYHLHLQLKEATEYAHQNGIIVKGDIAIGVYRFGADAWQSPDLYHMNMQAGAPPDDFAVKGQNWGFPTYNWHRMKEDGYAWWKQRFEQMSYYFDAFRIDHILGFFRIWSIPMHAVEGIMGHFVPAIPVHINEFVSRGIGFDYNRYVKPYINEAILWDVFGYDSGFVKERFLNYDGFDHYALKPEYVTQRQVEQHLAGWMDDDFTRKIKSGLFDLISNVLLFEEEGSGGQLFHFRFGMGNTRSFRQLDGDTQHKLDELYVNYFFRRQDDFWMKEAMQKLPALKRVTNMLVCGEDLGLVPSCVPEMMRQLGLLSLEIQRMPKDPTKEFFHPNDAPYLSVVTPSTHDMSTIRGWWEEDKNRIQRFYNHQLGQGGTAPHYCEAWINKAIVLQHLYSPSMWSIFQMQDILGSSEQLRRADPNDERINVPANPKHYWRYRMHIGLEQLLLEQSFNQEFKGFVSASGR
ncbi:MAG: 4-alpha-glucanotransferase, partial [Bacteroidota bacterium]|nr:4-alpha-glucanotransferase [Bacteroidota bacterium]